MGSAVYYNIFTVFMVAIMGLVTGVHIYRMSPDQREDRVLAHFWILFAGLWFFAGVRLIFHAAGSPLWDMRIFHVVQVFVALHLVPAIWFLAYRVFRRAWVARAGASLAVLCCAAFLAFVAVEGVDQKPPTPFGSEWELSPHAFTAFTFVFVPALALTLADLMLWLLRRLRRADRANAEYALVALSLLIYELAGVVDAKGLTAGWGLLALRGPMLVSAVIAYFAYSWTSTHLVIESSSQAGPAEPERKDGARER